MFTSNRGLHPPLQHVHEGEVWMHPLLFHQLWFEHALQGRRMKMERRRHRTRLSLEVVQTLPISTVNRKLKTKSLANIISQFQRTPRCSRSFRCETNVLAFYGIAATRPFCCFFDGVGLGVLGPGGRQRNLGMTMKGIRTHGRLHKIEILSPPWSEPSNLRFHPKADYCHPPFTHGPSALIWLITLPRLDEGLRF